MISIIGDQILKLLTGKSMGQFLYYTFIAETTTSECHSNWGGGNGLTNQNPPLAISVHSPPPLTCY
jgi:hypothetical protein